MRYSLLLLGMLLSSALVGCHTCSHCDGSFVGNDGVTYKPVKPNPIKKIFEKKECGCKKHKNSKHDHKGSDNCPFCTSEGEFVSGGMSFDGMPMGSSGCSGCGAPASMGPLGCSSCGMPSSNFSMPSSSCSSCGGAPVGMPISGCSSCQGGFQPGTIINGSPSPAPIFQGEVIPGNSPSPSPSPAPPAEDKPAAPMGTPMTSSNALIPILPPSSSPRHVHWVPTPVK